MDPRLQSAPASRLRGDNASARTARRAIGGPSAGGSRGSQPLPSSVVRNALGAVQSLLVLGGSSDIGAAIAERLVPDGCRTVVLAGRRPEAMEPVAGRLRAAGAGVTVPHWDAVDLGGPGGRGGA